MMTADRQLTSFTLNILSHSLPKHISIYCSPTLVIDINIHSPTAMT